MFSYRVDQSCARQQCPGIQPPQSCNAPGRYSHHPVQNPRLPECSIAPRPGTARLPKRLDDKRLNKSPGGDISCVPAGLETSPGPCIQSPQNPLPVQNTRLPEGPTAHQPTSRPKCKTPRPPHSSRAAIPSKTCNAPGRYTLLPPAPAGPTPFLHFCNPTNPNPWFPDDL